MFTQLQDQKPNTEAILPYLSDQVDYPPAPWLVCVSRALLTDDILMNVWSFLVPTLCLTKLHVVQYLLPHASQNTVASP